MASPFDKHRDHASPAGKWHVGETRTIFPKEGPQLTITRTSRDFACDWADAANEAHADNLRTKGLMWVPDPNGFTKLVRARERQHRTPAPAWLTPQSIMQMSQREFNDAVDHGWIMVGDDGLFVPVRQAA